MIAAMQGKIIDVKVLGYADFLNTPVYNQILSQKRCDGIKNYFSQKVIPGQINSISAKGLGERFSKDNGEKEGQPFMRRVDLIIAPFVIMQANNEPPHEIIEKHETGNHNKIENLAKGEALSLKGLNFEPGRHLITTASVPVLNNLLKVLQSNANIKIEIQGHICCLDGESDGMDMDTRQTNLSVSRAKAIYDFLIAKGIDEERLSYKGFGHSKPKVFPEKTPADEQINRRVEILVVDK